MRWTKLLINVPMSALSAALGCTFGEILDNEKAINIALALQQEVLETATMLNIGIEQVNGISFDHFLRELRDNRALARERLRDKVFFISYTPRPIEGLDSCCVMTYAIEGIPGFKE